MKRKVCLVTGASRGIGRGIALEFSKDYDVIINYAGNTEKAKECQKLCEDNGSNALIYQCDVSKFDDVKKMYEDVFEKYGRIDVVVNNAGIEGGNLINNMTEEEWDKTININLKGVFNSCKFASKYMMNQKSGRIINISSVVGMTGEATLTAYAASKAGVIGVTKSLAKELGGYNITVNAIAPGYIETDMTSVLDGNVKNMILNALPIKRFGIPKDIGKVAYFLSSDDGSYITGQVISVNGGMVI